VDDGRERECRRRLVGTLTVGPSVPT
jgi:hypothetical protein